MLLEAAWDAGSVGHGVSFHEVLRMRRAPAGWTLFFLSFMLIAGAPVLLHGAPWWPFALAGVALAAGTWFAGTETTITPVEIVLASRPLPWPRRIALTEVVAAEIVIADANTFYFGGWEGSRGGLYGAVTESIEGPRQVGNRSIRLELSSGKRVQFATWQPRAALAAIQGTA